jgi:hypothetical protein
VDAEDGGAGEVGDPGNGGFSVSSSVLRSDRRRFDNDDDALYPSLWFGSVWKTKILVVSGVAYSTTFELLE